MKEFGDTRNSSTTSLQETYDTVYASKRIDQKIKKLNLDRWPRNRWEAIVWAFPARSRNVLEIGCGNGEVLYNIANKCETLTGVEISEIRCNRANRNLGELKIPVEIIHGNIEEGIDKPDGVFDVILWADVIEHVVDVFVAMGEVRRLLAPGGTLITSTPNLAYIRRRLALLFGKFPSTASKNEGFAIRAGEMYDGGHMHYFTLGVLKRLYELNGLKPTYNMGFGRWGKLHNIFPTLLSGALLLVGVRE